MKILILAELHANEENKEEKRLLSIKIDKLHNELYNSTRWLVKPPSGNIITEEQINYIKGNNNYYFENLTIGDV